MFVLFSFSLSYSHTGTCVVTCARTQSMSMLYTNAGIVPRQCSSVYSGLDVTHCIEASPSCRYQAKDAESKGRVIILKV